jgi:hypothetical protein
MASINGENLLSPEKLFGRAAAFSLHTATVYIWAIHFAPWLIGRWFAWGAPTLGRSANVGPGDWYLQHLELVSTVPALLIGYIAAHHRAESVAVWAWAVPSLVLAYKILRFHSLSSVLASTPVSGLSYFFDIQRSMPTMAHLGASDPVRVLAQMTITAPFYTGIGYSLGALASKQRLLARIHPSPILRNR